MAGIVMREVAVKSEEYTNSHKLLVKSVIGVWWQRKHWLAVVRRIIEGEYLFRYGMQRNKGLHVRLLATLADEPSALYISLDVLWAKPCQIDVSQSCEYCKQEHVPCKFHLPLLERMGKQLFDLFTGEIADFDIAFHFFIFDILQRIGAQYLLVNCQKHKTAQPCQTFIGCRWAEVLPLSEEDVVVFP